MKADRRRFLTHAGIAAASAALTGVACQTAVPARGRAEPEGAGPPSGQTPDLGEWKGVRAAFELSPHFVHLAGMLLASHPTPVREALARHRHALDENPVAAVHHLGERDAEVYDAAARYMGAKPGSIALTDSTTMGLGLVYTGLKVKAGDELITTVHGHYSTRESLAYAARRSGAALREVTLYERGGAATEAEVVSKLRKSLGPATRVVAITWVHSSTGVKMPVRAIADAIGEVNRGRGEAERIKLCVDGVHGFGIEDVVVPELGCDFFIAGTHKWIFGPRGTGLIWGSERGWASVEPAIPPFDWDAFGSWLKGEKAVLPPGRAFTPGGFHSFEHRWALKEAFEMHLAMGKARVQERIHALASRAKAGLAKMKHVTLHTPMSPSMSSGIVCFEVAGVKPDDVVKRLLDEHAIIASTTPYAASYARFSTALFNTPEEIDRALAAIAAMG